MKESGHGSEVIVKIVLASSVDGKIADASGVWRPICPYDERRFYETMRWADAVVVGWRTLIHSGLDFELPERKIVKALIDPRGKADIGHSFFKRGQVVVFGHRELFPRHVLFELSGCGADVLLTDEYPISPSSILSYLRETYGAKRVLVAGGGATAWHFLERAPNVELQITYVPLVLGDSPYHNIRAPAIRYPGLRLTLVSAEKCECGQEVICVYRKASPL